MNTAKYLKRSDIYPIEPAGALHWENTHAVVIPVYDENDHIAATLASIKAALQRSPEPVKTVLVINEPINAAPEARENNRAITSTSKTESNFLLNFVFIFFSPFKFLGGNRRVGELDLL